MIQSRWDWETVFGATPKTATGTVALPSAKSQPGGQGQFGVDERGNIEFDF